MGGYTNSSSSTPTTYNLIEHWNGTSWSIVASPNPGAGNSLSAIAAVSAKNIWAVGYYNTSNSTVSQTLIEHWNGTRWNIVASPNLGSSYNFLSGVAAVSASNIWAVGSYTTSSTVSQTLIEQWNGTSWSIVASPNLGSNQNFLFGVVAVPGSSKSWVVGYYSNSSWGGWQTLIESYC